MRRSHVTFLYMLAAVVAFIFVTQAGLAQAADAPKAEATRTITVVKTAGPAPKAEEYRVGPGEHLWQILRRHLGGGSERQIARLYAKTLRLNPGLNPDVIEVGQKLLLPPVAGKAAAKSRKAAGPTRAAHSRARRGKGSGALRSAGAKAGGGAQAASAPPAAAQGAPASTQASTSGVAAARAGNALSALYAELGEDAITEGKQFIPLPDTGQIVLDASKFPLLQVGGSTRFVIDAAGHIPADVDELLAEADGLRILRYDPKQGLRGFLGAALTGSLGAKKGGTLVLPGPVEAKVHSDWVVTKGQERDVICLITSPDQATSAAVARHLATRGVHVIDVLAPPEAAGDAPVQVVRREDCELPEFKPPEVAAGKGEMVSRVLSLLGQGYNRNTVVSVFGNPGERFTGFSLRFCADFGFERDGKRCLIDVVGLSPRWREFLERRGYQVLALGQGEAGEQAAADLLRFLGQDFKQGYRLLASSRPEANNISLKVPGVVVDAGGRRFILSDAEADKGLACALSEAGLKVIELK